MEPSQTLSDIIQKPLSRKDFLSLTTKGLALGALGGLASCSGVNVSGTTPTATSPKATIPIDETKPIELEEWKSSADVKSAPTPTPLAPGKRLGYAVVGLGHLSLEEILPALSKCKKSRLAALVSGSPEKMSRVAKQYGIPEASCYSYETFDAIKNNPEVDIIYIVLPNGLHKEYVIRGARTGKHILCEKPMANSSAECREMIAACESANVKLMVAYRIHYQPHNRKLREILKSKDFGDIKFVDASNCQSSANPDHWRHKMALAGGGALPDIGLYCLNTTRFVLGMEPTEVFAYQHSTPGNPLFTEVEEMMSWQMKFPNGIVANCSTHYNVHESRYYRVLSERGWTHLDNAYAYKGQKLTVAQAKDKIRSIEEMTIAETDQFEVEMDYFSDCVMHDRRPFSTGEEGLHDHIIMEAIYESANSGRPVKIKSDVDLKNMRGPEALI